MSRIWKVILIVLASVFGVIIIAIAVISVIFFSSSNLAYSIRKVLNKQEQIEFTLDKADLVFFKTFPELSLHVENFGMKNKYTSDSILFAGDIFAALDIKAFLKRDELRVKKISMNGVYADISQFAGLFSSEKESPAPSSPFELPFGLIDVSALSAENLHIVYKDGGGTFAESGNLSLYAELKTEGNAGKGVVRLASPITTFIMNDTVYCENLPVYASLPFNADIDSMTLSLSDAQIKISDFALGVGGDVRLCENDNIAADLTLSVNEWNISNLMALLPAPFEHFIDGIAAGGLLSINLDVYGFLSEDEIPLIGGKCSLADINLKAPFIPVNIDNGGAVLSFVADLNKGGKTDVTIEKFSASSGGNNFSVSGKVNDLLGNAAFDLKLKSDMDIAEAMPLLPDSIRLDAAGRLGVGLKVKGTLEEIENRQFDKINASGLLSLNDFDAVYSDTVFVKTPDLKLDFALNGNNKYEKSENPEFAGLLSAACGAGLSFSSLDLTVGRALHAALDGSEFKAGLADIPLDGEPLSLYCDFAVEGLRACNDSMSVEIASPKGVFALLPSLRKPGGERVMCNYESAAISAHAGKSLKLNTETISIKVSADRDTNAKGLFAEWTNIDLRDGVVNSALFGDSVKIPSIRLAVRGDTLNIVQSSFLMGNSDFSLSGTVTDLDRFLSEDALLNADFDFVSGNADVDQLLSYFSGMGAGSPDASPVGIENGAAESAGSVTDEPADTAAATGAEKEAGAREEEGDPFIVPKGINLTLNTKIAAATAFGTTVNNVKGKVTIKDGVAILSQLGFTSDAAKMQLTAIYKSPRKNHLFAGIDFHLIDIEIDKLIKMIPSVDSIVPMLKSFAGQAEFHFAVETNLNSKYELKKSTLLGAASVEGKNLVVLDSKTFDTIADMLLFKKSQKNVIDSLAVDMTVFRDEVDIYPFVLSMDKYKLILSGRHNLDMSFNYHFDCISPIRLGLDVNGKLGNLKFKLTPTRYKNLFVPERRNDIQERTVRLMDMINSSLKEGIAVQPDTSVQRDWTSEN